LEQNDEKWSQILFQQFLDLFILPEIRRRKEAGKLEEPFNLRGAQIVFFADGKKPEIRLNSEIRAIANVKLKKGISKEKGDPIHDNEIAGLDKITLTEDEDPDCGHATLIRVQDSWIIAFDFRYNKGLAKKHIDAAKQFYDSAEFALTRKSWSSCLDNLFSAAELAAKAVLLLMPDPKFRKRVKHGGIQQRYNNFADLGNVKPEYRDALNKLSGLRPRARYLQGEIPISEAEIHALLESVKKMITDAMERI
jgi:HEPN domain-containing protein